MKPNHVRKLASAGVLVALGVALSPISFPVGASRCYPIQHMINVLAAVFLGPAYGTGMAFAISAIRVSLGTGSLLAFPGSMLGALTCGLIYRYSRNLPLTYAGEVAGTGMLGGLVAYPVAALVMGREAALLTYVLPFLVSTAGGTLIAAVLIAALQKTGAFEHMQKI